MLALAAAREEDARAHILVPNDQLVLDVFVTGANALSHAAVGDCHDVHWELVVSSDVGEVLGKGRRSRVSAARSAGADWDAAAPLRDVDAWCAARQFALLAFLRATVPASQITTLRVAQWPTSARLASHHIRLRPRSRNRRAHRFTATIHHHITRWTRRLRAARGATTCYRRMHCSKRRQDPAGDASRDWRHALVHWQPGVRRQRSWRFPFTCDCDPAEGGHLH